MLLSGDSTGRLRLYDLSAGSLAWMTRSGSGEVSGCGFVTGSYAFASLTPFGRFDLFAPWSKEPLSTRGASSAGVNTTLEVADSGRILVTGGRGYTAIVWDASEVAELAKNRLSTVVPTDSDLAAAWGCLGDFDGRRAWSALLALLVRPEFSLPLLQDQLLQSPAGDLETVLRQVRALDDDNPEERDRATAELLAGDVDPFLDDALKRTSSPEAIARLTEVIHTRRDGLRVSCSSDLQRSRAIQILEMLDSEAARKVLGRVVAKSRYPRACRDAREALDRMKRR